MRREICIGISCLLMMSQAGRLQAAMIASDATSFQPASNFAPSTLAIPNLAGTNVETEPVSEEWLRESASSLEIEHESNGPEGAPGVPMRRASVKQIALAVGIILACWGVMILDRRHSVSGNLLK